MNDALKQLGEGRRIYLASLGCDKNTVDAEYMLGDLLAHGFLLTDDCDEADLFIVNTCCFIDEAKAESVDTILACLPYVEENGAKLIVSGCMAERYKQELEEEIPEIDGFIGVKETDRILSLFEEDVAEEKPVRYIPEGQKTAYLKISEGCSRHCTYCAIPGIRGPHRSRKPDDILEEAKLLEGKGVKELILIAQDLTQYGDDHPEYPKFAALLKRIAEETDFPWIRLLYLYPEGIDEELIDVIRTHENILPYFDLPLQHTRGEILRRMGRRITPDEIREKIRMIRNALPDAVLRTSIITGFPGETEEDHENLLADLDDLSFDKLGVFAYSQEENTPAASFENQIDDETKQRRMVDILTKQEKIGALRNKCFENTVQKVLIETVEEENVYQGRIYADAPEIDGVIYIESEEPLEIGQFYDVRVVQALGYELTGDLCKA